METMQPADYLTAVVVPLLKHPGDFKVTAGQDAMGVILRCDLHQEDMGSVIGKDGKTAEAIRLLTRIVGMRNNARVSIKINEPEGSSYKRKA